MMQGKDGLLILTKLSLAKQTLFEPSHFAGTTNFSTFALGE